MSTISSDRAKSIAAARSTPRPDRRSARPNPTARPKSFRPSTWRVAPDPEPASGPEPPLDPDPVTGPEALIGCRACSAGRRRLRQQLAHAGAADVPDVLF